MKNSEKTRTNYIPKPLAMFPIIFCSTSKKQDSAKAIKFDPGLNKKKSKKKVKI